MMAGMQKQKQKQKQTGVATGDLTGLPGDVRTDPKGKAETRSALV